MIPRKLPQGFSMGKLWPKHASLVNSCWEFGNTISTEARIRYQIERLPTVCIYNEKEEPVSWHTVHIDGSGAIGYTLPAYRKMGLYSINMAELTFQRNQMNFPNFSYIREGNVAALKASSMETIWPQNIIFVKYNHQKTQP